MFPLEGSEILQVGYVKTEDPGYYEVDFTGWWPDALLPVEQMYAEPGEAMPVWINLRSTQGMEAGTYRGELAVSLNGKPAGKNPAGGPGLRGGYPGRNHDPHGVLPSVTGWSRKSTAARCPTACCASITSSWPTTG